MRRRPVLATLVLVTLAALAACGDDTGDDDDDDVPMIDAPVGGPDAPDPDASSTGACATLCDCMETYCGDDRAACISECEGLGSTARACRITHCGYAQTPGMEAIHCPHARGDESDNTTPQECIGP